MPSLPGVNHLRAVAALQKAGFQIVRQGKHITMSNQAHRHRAAQQSHQRLYDTKGGIVRDAGLSNEQFRVLL